MAYIDSIKDGLGRIFFPRTKEKAITDDNNILLSDKLTAFGPLIDCDCTYLENSNTYLLEPKILSVDLPQIFSVRFKAPNNYVLNATFTLKDNIYIPKLSSGTDNVPSGSFSKDSIVTLNFYREPNYYEKIYGITRNTTSTSPIWSRTDDSEGLIANSSLGTKSVDNDFNSCYPWSEITRELLSTGDVMVKIPKFYFRRYKEGNFEHIKITGTPIAGFRIHPAFTHNGVEVDYIYVGAYKTSNNNRSISGATPQVSQTRATFRNNAKSKGEGWSIIDISVVSAIQMLILVEFANNDVQSVIGKGYCEKNTDFINTGTCDNVANLTGRPEGTDGKTDVVWRGIEGFWGNVWEITDGINWNNGVYYVCNNISLYSDDTAVGYSALSFNGETNWSSSYITEIGIDDGANNHIMLPSKASGGNSATYFCDVCSSSTGWKMLRRGGIRDGGVGCGLFMSFFNSGANNSSGLFGSRLIYVPTNNT